MLHIGLHTRIMVTRPPWDGIRVSLNAFRDIEVDTVALPRRHNGFLCGSVSHPAGVLQAWLLGVYMCALCALIVCDLGSMIELLLSAVVFPWLARRAEGRQADFSHALFNDFRFE